MCTAHLTVFSYHVAYTFQSGSTIYSCLNIKELLPRSRQQIWKLSDCQLTRTQNHLVPKRRLNHLAKLTNWLSCDSSIWFVIHLFDSSIWCIWLYVLVMSRTRFRVNPDSIVAWMSRSSLLKAGAKS